MGGATGQGTKGRNYLRIANIGGGADMVRGKTAAVGLPGNVSITSGGDSDEMRLYIENHTQVTIDSGDTKLGGKDTVLLSGSRLYKLAIGVDQNTADVSTREFRILACQVDGKTQVNFGGGKDNLVVESIYTQLNGGLFIDAPGQEQVSALIGGASQFANDRVQIKGGVEIVATGGGAANIWIDHVNLTGTLSIRGSGPSVVRLNQLTATNRITVDCGNEDDDVGIGTTIAPATDLDGAAGQDRLTFGTGNDLGQKTVKNFESVHQQ